MRSLLRFGLLAVLFSFAGNAFADDLGPGSPAPKIEIKTWYKGTPVTGFEPGKIYVVEFWATWCGPCKESIPHLTELAKKMTDVTFIGVGAFEEDKDDNIKKFVATMGDKMDYNVGYTGNRDGMAKSWMMAANQNGIPASFIVKDGTVQWIGHPSGLEEPLKQLMDGTFDLPASKAKFEKANAANKQANAVNKSMADCEELFKSGKLAEAKQRLEEAVKKYPQLAGEAETQRFFWLASEDSKKWQTTAKQYADSKKPELIQKLLSFGLRQSGEKGDLFKNAELAFQLADKATDGKDFRVQQYAATFYSNAKDPKKELVYVKKLIAVFPNSPYKDQPDALKYWQDRAKDLETKVKG